MKIIISFLISFAAGIAATYACKWLGRYRKVNSGAPVSLMPRLLVLLLGCFIPFWING